MSTVFTVIFGIAIVAIGFALNRMQSKMALSTRSMGGSNIRDLTLKAFEETGFERADMVGQPFEAQADRSLQDWGKQVDNHLIRRADGLEYQFMNKFTAGGTGNTYVARWWIEASPNIGLHIVDRKVVKDAKKLVSMTGMRRTLTRQFEQEVQVSGAFGERFLVLSDAPQQASSIMLNPELQAALQDLAEVDLRVIPGEISLNDPLMINARDGMSPMQMASAGLERNFEALAKAHQRVTKVLKLIHQLTVD